MVSSMTDLRPDLIEFSYNAKPVKAYVVSMHVHICSLLMAIFSPVL